MIRSVGIVPSGAQLWQKQVVSINERYYVYASSWNILVFSLAEQRLLSILCPGKGDGRVKGDMMTKALALSPTSLNTMAVATTTSKLVLYNIENGLEQSSVSLGNQVAVQLLWKRHDPASLWVLVDKTQLMSWDAKDGTIAPGITTSSPITAFSQSTGTLSKLVVACADGQLALYDITGSLKKPTIKVTLDCPATGIDFDSAGTNYFLAVLSNGMSHMYSADDMQAASTFVKQPASDRLVHFVPGAPGQFVTTSDKYGAMQVWNVINPTPLRNVKLGHNGVQCSTVSPSSPYVMVGFKDGSVGLYDLRSSRWMFHINDVHAEAIYCVSMSPSGEFFATSSYDRTVKVWSADTFESVESFDCAPSVLYSVCWASETTLVASCQSGEVIVYERGCEQVKHMYRHSDKAIHKVACSPIDSRIAVATAEGCDVRSLDGKTVVSLPGCPPSSGVDWSPLTPHRLAVSSCAGEVTVWDVVPDEVPVFVKRLHFSKDRVFNVAWSPLLDDWLAVTCDDGTAVVASLAEGAKSVLRGHTSKVRAITWHPSCPTLLFTGSWDSTIRVWDTRTGSCLGVMQGHNGDVYGLGIASQQPMTMISTSRDSTLRVWSLLPLFTALLHRAIFKDPFTGTPEAALAGTGMPLLSCKDASGLQTAITKSESALERYTAVWHYFGDTPYVRRLWELVKVYMERFDLGNVRAKTPRRRNFQTTMHHTMLHMALKDKAAKLDMDVEQQLARGRASGLKQKDLLTSIAMSHLQAGNVEQYCEMMIRVGDWSSALAAAPAAGTEYWKKLAKRRAVAALQEGAIVDDVLPVLLAAGHNNLAAELLTKANRYDDAAAALITANLMPAPPSTNLGASLTSMHDSIGTAVAETEDEDCGLLPDGLPPTPGMNPNAKIRSSLAGLQLTGIRLRQALELYEAGQPLHAACCAVSVDAIQAAITVLSASGQFALAYCVAHSVDCTSQLAPSALAFARRLCQTGQVELAAELLQALPDSPERSNAISLVACACAVYAAPVLEDLTGHVQLDTALMAKLQMKLGFRDAEKAAKMATMIGGVPRVKMLILSGEHGRAASELCALLAEAVPLEQGCDVTVHNIAELVEVLDVLQPWKLPVKARMEVTLWMVYLGAQRAIARGWPLVARFCFEQCCHLVRVIGRMPTFAVSISALRALEAVQLVRFEDPVVAVERLERLLASSNLDDSSATPVKEALQTARGNSEPWEPRRLVSSVRIPEPDFIKYLRKAPMILPGSQIISQATGSTLDCVSGQAVRGPTVKFGSWTMSVSNCAMLAQVMVATPDERCQPIAHLTY